MFEECQRGWIRESEYFRREVLGQTAGEERKVVGIQEVRRVMEEVLREGMKDSGYSSLEFSITKREGSSFRQGDREKSGSPLVRELENVLTPSERNTDRTRNLVKTVNRNFIFRKRLILNNSRK